MEGEQERKTEAEVNPHVYKPTYTRQELDELARWFEERMERLPAALQIDEATRTSDLPRTVKALLALLKTQKGNVSVTFSGYMFRLQTIRSCLEKQGME